MRSERVQVLAQTKVRLLPMRDSGLTSRVEHDQPIVLGVAKTDPDSTFVSFIEIITELTMTCVVVGSLRPHCRRRVSGLLD